jgi:hypothetical protein
MVTRWSDPAIVKRLVVGFVLVLSVMVCVVYVGVSYREPIDAAATQIYGAYLKPLLSLTGLQGLVNGKSHQQGDCGSQGEGSRSSLRQERGLVAARGIEGLQGPRGGTF